MGRRKNQQGEILAKLIGFVVCIGLPAFGTAISPVSWIRFERNQEHVAMTAET